MIYFFKTDRADKKGFIHLFWIISISCFELIITELFVYYGYTIDIRIVDKVSVVQKIVTIPTYEPSEPCLHPMFLEKRVYQGSSGKVYPHPISESVSDEKIDKKYTAIFLEMNI